MHVAAVRLAHMHVRMHVHVHVACACTPSACTPSVQEVAAAPRVLPTTDYRLLTPILLLLTTTTTHYYYCSLLADYSSPTRHRSPRLYEYSTMAAPEGFEGTFVAVTSVPGQGQG